MLVTPVPVTLLIVLFELGEIAGFAMVLFCIDTIRLILLTVPCMAVIVLFVLIGARGPLILGAQYGWRQCYWDHKGGAQQGGTPKTGHGCFVLLLTNVQLQGQAVAGGGGECNE